MSQRAAIALPPVRGALSCLLAVATTLTSTPAAALAPPAPEAEEPGPKTEEAQSEPEPEPEPESAPEPEPDPEPDPVPPPAVPSSPVPQRLPAMQVGAWWTLFGAFALASTAGVFSGLAERQEDKAIRLASRFDQETGAQPVYSDEQDEYEKIIDSGRAYQNAAVAIGAVAGATAIAATVLFIVDARRHRPRRAKQRAHAEPGGGLRVRF